MKWLVDKILESLISHLVIVPRLRWQTVDGVIRTAQVAESVVRQRFLELLQPTARHGS
jgi:hypothetical protein